MGEIIAECADAAKAGFSWIHDAQAFNVFVKVALAYLILPVLAGIAIALLFGFSFVVAASGGKSAGIGAMLGIAVVFLVGLAVAFIVYAFLYLKLISAAFKLNGLEPFEVTVSQAVRYLFLSLAATILAIAGGFDNRLKALFIAVLVAGALAAFGLASGSMVFFALFLLLLVPYAFSLIYCSGRLSMSVFVFAEKRLSITESLKYSWDSAEGSVVRIVARTVITGLIVSILLAVVFFIPTFVIDLMAGANPSFMGSTLKFVWSSVTNAFQAACIAFSMTYVYFIFRSWNPDRFKPVAAAPRIP